MTQLPRALRQNAIARAGAAVAAISGPEVATARTARVISSTSVRGGAGCGPGAFTRTQCQGGSGTADRGGDAPVGRRVGNTRRRRPRAAGLARVARGRGVR